ncbi:hypothetical protein [Actinomyces sp. 432]|nr:hypothetical protein [Actinomyces sp. 432]
MLGVAVTVAALIGFALAMRAWLPPIGPAGDASSAPANVSESRQATRR